MPDADDSAYDGYEKAAYFFAWVSKKYRIPDLPRRLTVATYTGTYSDALWVRWTGKTVPRLWKEMTGRTMPLR